MKFRRILNIVTLVLIAVVLVLARGHLVQAWHLLGKVNIWLLLLLIPVQIFSYYATGAIFLIYLRARGRLRRASNWETASMALELNFVNHVFPSGGISGISYMVWRLGKHKVSAGQATMAQLMAYVIQLGTFFVLLAIALLFVASDGRVSGWIVMVSAAIITALILLVIFASYIVGSERRMRSFARWLSGAVGWLLRKISFGHIKKNPLPAAKSEKFFLDFHRDFLALKNEKSLLLKPIGWAFVSNLTSVALFWITFFALGTALNPALLLIAFGASSLAGLLVLTPGGTGAYEAIMVGILTMGGVAASAAFAGVILTRVILLVGTIAVGYVFYHRALHKFGKPAIERHPSRGEIESKLRAAESEDAENSDLEKPVAKNLGQENFAKSVEEKSENAELEKIKSENLKSAAARSAKINPDEKK